MIYKTLKKVSEYCQVIKNGTFQDGFNGWSSQEISYNIIDGICYCTINAMGYPSIYTFQPTIIKHHKYLISFDIFPNYSNSANANGFYLKGGTEWYTIIQNQWNKVEKIVTVTWDTKGVFGLYVNINTNKTIGDIANFKNIQLFDLTEMYGAGNEPTTVEEFRTKFPNELYDYKPYCFVKSYKTLLKATDDKIITSYKKSLVCKTKNLFNINTTPTFNNTKATYVVEGTKVTFKSNNTANNSFFYSIPTTVGKTYTVSVNSIDWDSTSLGIFLSSAKIEDKLDYGLINKTILTKTFVAVSNTLWIHGYLSYQAGDFTFTFDKLQVELGDTATDYVPYGHL